MSEPHNHVSAGIESAGFSDIEAAQAIASIANECCYRRGGWEEHIAEEGLKIIRSIRGTPAPAQGVMERATEEACRRFSDEVEQYTQAHIDELASLGVKAHPAGKITVDRGNLRYAFIEGARFASQPSPAATVEKKSAPPPLSSLPSGESGPPVMATVGGADTQCSAGSEPVAWTNESQLWFLKDAAYAGAPMAMWDKRSKSSDVPLYRVEPQEVQVAPFVDGLKEAREQLIKIRDAIIESGALNNRDKYLDLGIETNRVIDRAWNLLNFSPPVSRPELGSGK